MKASGIEHMRAANKRLNEKNAFLEDGIARRDTVILRLERELAKARQAANSNKAAYTMAYERLTEYEARADAAEAKRDEWIEIYNKACDRIAALERELAEARKREDSLNFELGEKSRELAEAKKFIAEIREPLLDYIGTTDPHELKIQLVERGKWAAEAKKDSARWRTAHVELCAAIARMPIESECRRHRYPILINTDDTHRQPLIELFYKQRATLDSAREE